MTAIVPMTRDPLQPQTLVAAGFSLVVGFAAGLFASWPEPVPIGFIPPPTPAKVATAPAPVPPTNACESFGKASGPYQFTGDYFTTEGRIPVWNQHVMPLGAGPIHYLEVGVYEGRSMIWMLENVLQHPDSTATGIDLVFYRRYMENLVRSGACEKVRNLQGRSQDVLRTLPKDTFDIVYIDGSHLAQDVLVDAVLAFDVLKRGGIMVFDDYRWYTNWASDIRPQVAIDAFVTAYRHELEFVHRGYQLMLKKRAHPCEFNKYRFSPVGNYCYQWVTGEFVRQSDRKAVKLMAGEKEIIETIARSAPFGEIDLVIDEAMRRRPEYQALNRRLKIFPERP